MSIARFSLARQYARNVSIPAIVEQLSGEYVLYESHKRLMKACEAHNEMLLLRAQKAEAELEAIGAGGVSLMGADRTEADRWKKMLPLVRMTMDAHGAMFYVRGKVDPSKDCSVAEHFTATIDATRAEPHGAAAATTIEDRARQLIHDAVQAGQVVRIDLIPRQPLAMGNFDMVADVRPARTQKEYQS